MRTLNKIVLAAVASLGLVGAAGAASAATPWQLHHPRQSEVLARVHRQERVINFEQHVGFISPYRAQMLRERDWRIAREDHRDARINGGFITKGQQRFLNGQENRAHRAI